MRIWPPETIVVPVDFSDDSYAAVNDAIKIVGAGGQVHVVHVVEDIPIMEPGMVYGTISPETCKSKAEEALKKRLAELNLTNVRVHVLAGDPGSEISEYAKATDANLIIMPSHGRRGLERWLIGSVAERVMRLATCPVMILKS